MIIRNLEVNTHFTAGLRKPGSSQGHLVKLRTSGGVMGLIDDLRTSLFLFVSTGRTTIYSRAVMCQEDE